MEDLLECQDFFQRTSTGHFSTLQRPVSKIAQIDNAWSGTRITYKACRRSKLKLMSCRGPHISVENVTKFRIENNKVYYINYKVEDTTLCVRDNSFFLIIQQSAMM